MYRIFKGDKWTRALGSQIPEGTRVKVIKFMARRRVLVEYCGKVILTLLWCLKKEEDSHGRQQRVGVARPDK